MGSGAGSGTHPTPLPRGLGQAPGSLGTTLVLQVGDGMGWLLREGAGKAGRGESGSTQRGWGFLSQGKQYLPQPCITSIGHKTCPRCPAEPGHTGPERSHQTAGGRTKGLQAGPGHTLPPRRDAGLLTDCPPLPGGPHHLQGNQEQGHQAYVEPGGWGARVLPGLCRPPLHAAVALPVPC